jgi:hypothetical protein
VSPREAISSEAEIALSNLIALLRPLELKSGDLVRVGGYKDGAYVMADTFASADAAASLGVGADVSWDCAIADRGIPIWQYDHSVEQPERCKGPGFTFDKRKVVVEARAKEELTLKEIFEIEGLRDKRNIILKIDIEGDEWMVLETLPHRYLSRVNQLIVEFHNFQNAWHPEWSARAQGVLRCLRTVFTPVHLHGNNCGGFCQLGGLTFPRAVEVSFVKSSENLFGQPIQFIPHAELDAPNNPDFADLRFRF